MHLVRVDPAGGGCAVLSRLFGTVGLCNKLQTQKINTPIVDLAPIPRDPFLLCRCDQLARLVLARLVLAGLVMSNANLQPFWKASATAALIL